MTTNSPGQLFVVAPTPFTSAGDVDIESVDCMTDFFIAAGAAGITVLGQMGEAPKLDLTENLELATRIIRRASVPVVVGVSAPGFAGMRSLSKAVMGAGAFAVMIAPPVTLRTDDQIVGYYQQAAAALGPTPIVIQDYPLTFSVVMTPGVIRRIVESVPSVMMLKHEDWPGLDKITALRAFEQAGDMRHISILCGNGGLFLDFEPARGADGAMTGYCFPDALVEIISHSAAGDKDAAHDLFDAHLPLIRYEQQPAVGLAVRKYVLMRRGIIKGDTQRSPSKSLSASSIREIEYLLQRLARTDSRAHSAL